MRNQCYPSMTSLLNEAFNLRSAVVVNHTLREIVAFDLEKFDPRNARPTKGSLTHFFITHMDYTPASARAHFRAVRPE
jgi:hypothetical protein